MTTIGISPKLIAAVVTAITTYLLGQDILTLPPVAVVAGQAVLIAIAAYTAPSGSVAAATASSSDERLPDSARAGIPPA